MDPSGSLIKSCIEDVRSLLNEATFDAKYPDSVLVRQNMASALATLVARVNEGADDRIMVRMPITFVTGQEYYNLPANVQEVLRITTFDSQGGLISDWRPRGEMHPNGPGWALDGTTLRLNPFPTMDIDVDLWYVPSGFVAIHYGEGGMGVSGAFTFTLQSTPTLGLRGRGENEYVGCLLRILDSSGYHSERIITAYDPLLSKVSLRTPLPTLSSSTGLKYEIVPAWSKAFWPAVATSMAIRLGAGRKITERQEAALINQYRSDVKTLRDTLWKMKGRLGRFFDRDTIDNDLAYMGWANDLFQGR